MSRSLKLSLAAFSVALVLAGILVAGAAFIEGAYALAGLAAAVFFGAAIGIPLVVGGQIVRFIKGLSVTPPSSSGAGLVGWRSALGEPIRQSDLLEERIERLRVSERLDAVNRLKGGVAHDLNNKLMVISANVDAVAKQLSDRPALERKLASALVACDQAATLISKVLTFTRRHEQQVQVIDVSRQIASVAMLLGRSFRTSAIEVRCLLPEKLWTVRVDPEEFEATIIHFGVHVRDALPNGARVTFEARNRHIDRGDLTDADFTGDCVHINIRGAQPDHVFDETEVRAERSLMMPTDSIGDQNVEQAFAFVKESRGVAILERSGERAIAIDFYLPRVVPTPRAVPPKRAAGARRDAAKKSDEILIVDDEMEVASALQNMLESMGYVVRIETAPDDAIAQLRRRPPDLVLADVTMPGPMDGVSFAREVRRDYPDLPILLLTGNTALPKEWGGFPLLRKPIVGDDLDAAIQRSLPAVAGGRMR